MSVVGRMDTDSPGDPPIPRRPRRRIWAKIAAAVAAAAFVGQGAVAVRYAPDLARLPALARAQAVNHGGTYVPLRDVSPWFAKALIATEDATFYHNWGISFEGIARALVVDIRLHRFAEGGSTLTQELVRDLLLTPRKTLTRKLTGTILSLYTAAFYSKPEVLTMFVNEVYLGDGAYGVQAASERYFGIPARSLTLPEATLLAGLPQAPSYYDPLVHYALAKARQREVLDRMVATGMISRAEAARAYAAPLPLR